MLFVKLGLSSIHGEHENTGWISVRSVCVMDSLWPWQELSLSQVFQRSAGGRLEQHPRHTCTVHSYCCKILAAVEGFWRELAGWISNERVNKFQCFPHWGWNSWRGIIPYPAPTKTVAGWHGIILVAGFHLHHDQSTSLKVPLRIRGWENWGLLSWRNHQSQAASLCP